MHVHTVDACLATAVLPDAATELPLPPLEMIKGLGVWEQAPRVSLPVFENLADVPALARAIAARFALQLPALPVLMIRGHGVTVWGTTVQQAYDRVEVLEFIMSYLARRA